MTPTAAVLSPLSSSTPTTGTLPHTNGKSTPSSSTKPTWTAISKPLSSPTTSGTQVAGGTDDVSLDSIPETLEAFARGEPVIVVDDMSRENEGDVIVKADGLSAEVMAWTIRHTSGYICISLPRSRLEELDIPMMVSNNTEKHRTAYTITVDYRHGTTTGISAHDRALTARKLVDPTSKPEDFSRPGHMVPLRAVEGGVRERRGHTESAVDLCVLASKSTNTTIPTGAIICELVKPDCPQGSMARRDDCWKFARDWGLKMISIEQLVEWREKNEA